jgi:hypothetical protein
MRATASSASVRETSPMEPVLIGGAIAGTLDQIYAFITVSWHVPRADVAGPLRDVLRHRGVPDHVPGGDAAVRIPFHGVVHAGRLLQGIIVDMLLTGLPIG